MKASMSWRSFRHTLLVLGLMMASGALLCAGASGTNPQITAMLEGAPAGVAPLSITAESDRTFFEVVSGVDVINRGGTLLRLNYEGGFSRNTSRHTVGFKLAVPF